MTLSGPSDAESHNETATEAYLAGLRAYGWRGEDKDVRFAATATGALQVVSFAGLLHRAALPRVRRGAAVAGGVGRGAVR